jgi:hypothetical protein
VRVIRRFCEVKRHSEFIRKSFAAFMRREHVRTRKALCSQVDPKLKWNQVSHTHVDVVDASSEGGQFACEMGAV